MQPDYTKLSALTLAIEGELKALNAWSASPLDPKKLIDMGAFASNTMVFEEWIQFILLDRIHQIIEAKDSLPSESMVATYAIREFDGRDDYSKLLDLLRQLDDMCNGEEEGESSIASTPLLGADVLPDSLRELAKILHTLEGDYLESQLQTFDIMIPYLPEGVRAQVEDAVRLAAGKAPQPLTKERLERALRSLKSGNMICQPYDHEAEMKKYRAEFRKGYPDLYPEG